MSQISVATTGTRILLRNNRRKSFLILNTDSANPVWIDMVQPSASTAATNSVKIIAGASFALNAKDDGAEQVQEEWSGTAVTSAVTIAVFESFYKDEMSD